jgi:hypothetical protein
MLQRLPHSPIATQISAKTKNVRNPVMLPLYAVNSLAATRW